MRRLPTKDPTLIQVLSLYLLLLAFFVLLFNASQYDRSRAAAVKESLSSTFRMHGSPANDPVARSSDQGQSPGAELILDSFSDLIRTELKVAKIENLQRGRLLRVTLGADELFVAGSAELRPDREKLVTKLAQLLGISPPGLRHKVEAFLAGDWIPPDRMTQAVPMPIARAAALAETLISRGALNGTVSGGTRHSTRSEIVLIYRVDPEIRPEDQRPQSVPESPASGAVDGRTL